MFSNHCKIYVEFDNEQRQYYPNEHIQGKVVVEVLKETNCRALTISHGWQTHGKGNQDKKIFEKKMVFSGQWQVGKYRYPFSFTAKDDPFSYHGNLLNMDWYIFVESDLSMAKDINYQADYLLLPIERKQKQQKILAIKQLEFNRKTKVPIFLVVGVFLIGIGIFWAWDSELGRVSFLSFGLYFFLLSAILCFVSAFYSYKEFLLGVVTTNIVEKQTPNRHLQVDLAFCPKQSLILENVHVQVVLAEEIYSGSGSSRSSDSHEFVYDEQFFSMYQRLPARKPYPLSTFMLNLPEILTPTICTANNKLAWLVKYNIKTNNQEVVFTAKLSIADG